MASMKKQASLSQNVMKDLCVSSRAGSLFQAKKILVKENSPAWVKLVVDSTKLPRGPSRNVKEVFNAGMLGASPFQELVTHAKSP